MLGGKAMSQALLLGPKDIHGYGAALSTGPPLVQAEGKCWVLPPTNGRGGSTPSQGCMDQKLHLFPGNKCPDRWQGVWIPRGSTVDVFCNLPSDNCVYVSPPEHICETKAGLDKPGITPEKGEPPLPSPSCPGALGPSEEPVH